MSKILFFCHAKHEGGGITTGPAIRAYNIAKALAGKGHIVTLAEKGRDTPETVGRLSLVPWDEKILEGIRNFDAAYIQIWSNNSDFLKKVSQVPLVVDVYAPHMIEHIYHDYSPADRMDMENYRDNLLLPSINPFLYGDLFICANDRQRKFFLGMLAAVGRLSPLSKGRDLVKIVPSGMREEEPKHGTAVLKKKPELKGKKIILWMGPLFPWYDPFTLIEAMGIVVKKHKEYALVIIGGTSPKVPEHLTKKMYSKSVSLCEKLKLLGKNIFFYDWLDYSLIQSIYLESEFFVSTHPETLEMELSAEKGRVIDSLWACLPVVCSQGDYLSEIIESEHLGLTAKIGDKADVAQKILQLIEKPALLSAFRKNIAKYAKKRRWEDMVKPLDDFFRRPEKDNAKSAFSIYSTIIESQESVEKSMAELAILKEEMFKKDAEIRSMAQAAGKQAGEIGKFRGSVTYPMYRFTSAFGRTWIGASIRRLLK